MLLSHLYFTYLVWISWLVFKLCPITHSLVYCYTVQNTSKQALDHHSFYWLKWHQQKTAVINTPWRIGIVWRIQQAAVDEHSGLLFKWMLPEHLYPSHGEKKCSKDLFGNLTLFVCFHAKEQEMSLVPICPSANWIELEGAQVNLSKCIISAGPKPNSWYLYCVIFPLACYTTPITSNCFECVTFSHHFECFYHKNFILLLPQDTCFVIEVWKNGWDSRLHGCSLPARLSFPENVFCSHQVKPL